MERGHTFWLHIETCSMEIGFWIQMRLRTVNRAYPENTNIETY